MTDKQTAVARTGEVFTFRLHWRVVQKQLQNAQERPAGSISELMAALTFAAFTIEAYVNYVGSREILDLWKDKRFRTNTPTKIEEIFKCLQIDRTTIDVDTEDAIDLLRNLRNEFAHGKQVLSSVKIPVPPTPISREQFDAMQFKIPLYEDLKDMGFDGVKKIIDKVPIFIGIIHTRLALQHPNLSLGGEDVLSGPLSHAHYDWPHGGQTNAPHRGEHQS